MGIEKYRLKIGELFARSPVVSYQSIARIVNSNSKSKQYAKQLIHHMLAKGNIKRLSKGHYTRFDDPSLAVYCFQPAYLGLQDALSFHNLWEQETIPVVITTKKVRLGIRKVFGMNVLIRHIDKKYFFGYDYIKQDGFYLPYSCIEKTIIDMVYFREKINKELSKEIKKRVDFKRLSSYMNKYPGNIKKSVLKIISDKIQKI